METNVVSGFSIEVVQSWKGQALDTELVSLDRPRRIAVGEVGRFLIPIGESFDLVVVENGRATVHVPARATALLAEGESEREIGAESTDRAIVIGASTHTQVAIGDMTFTVRAVEQAKEKFAAPIVDSTGWRWIGAALAFHVAILATFFFVPPDASALSSDLTGENMRYIQVHLDAVEPTPPPPVPSSGGDSTGGATSDAPASSDTTGPVSPTPSVAGGPNRPARAPRTVIAPTAQDVAEFGTFQHLAQMFANQDADASPYDTGNLIADGTFGPGTSRVPGGLDDGFGPGGVSLHQGHGTCTQEPCGVGTIDQDGFDTHGGSHVGPGPDLDPHGPATHTPVIHACQAGDPDCRTAGGLTREQIRAVIARHRPEVRYCYEQALVSRPDLEGRVTVGFQIQQDGHVSTSNASGMTGVDSCVAQAVHRWQFPTSTSPTIVSYPFVMESTSGH